MKKITTISLFGTVLLIFIFLLVAGLFIPGDINAGTEMDQKIILAMEKIKEEMKNSGEQDNLTIKKNDDEIMVIPVLEPESTGIEGEIIPENTAPAAGAPVVKEETAPDVEKISVVEEVTAALPVTTPGPEIISLKQQLEQRIPLHSKDGDIRKVLRSLARTYSFNMIIAPEVHGKVTVDLNNVKIIDALKTILVDQGLGYRINGNILRVTSLEKIQAEEEKETQMVQQAAIKAKKAADLRKDQEAAEPLVVKIFKLKYIDANDAKEAIKPMISPNRGKVMVLQTQQYTGFEFEATEEFGVKNSNKAATEFVRSRTLIVQDIQTVLDRIDTVISKIDQRPPQIMIDAKVLEVPVDQEFRLGVNWTQALNQWKVGAKDIKASFDRKFTSEKVSKDENSRRWGEDNTNYNENFNKRDINDGTSNGSLSYAGSSFPGSDDSNVISIPGLIDWGMIDRPGGPYQENTSWQAVVSTDLAKRGYNATDSRNIFDNYLNVISDTLTNLTTSGQAYSAILGAADFQLMLSAMKTDSNIVILSNPRIIVHENYAAKIFVGQRYPILKTEVGSEGGGSVGGTSVDEWKEIGITLKVIPQVRASEEGEADRINMIVHPAVSKQSGFAFSVDNSGNQVYSSYPIIDIREADTNVTIHNGDTIVIGGLISSYTVDEEDKIPLLGDIPILGYLFKEKHTVLKKTNLLIFITARIVTEDTGLSSYEKIMLEKSPADALEDIRYIENEDLRPNLYKSKKDLEDLKSEAENGAVSDEENDGDKGGEEDSSQEDKENNLGNFKGRQITKATERSRIR